MRYRYSIAIENTAAPDYFTEKINDCFLAYTVPIYYGAINIGKYFPPKSFIQIDINQPGQSIKKIQQLLVEDDWNERLADLQEARELVLNKYQPLAGAAAILREIKTAGTKKEIFLEPLPLTLPVKVMAFVKQLTGKRP